MVRYWRRHERRVACRAVTERAGAVATGVVALLVVETKFAGRLGSRGRRSRCSSSASTWSTATTARSGRRLRAGAGGRGAPAATNEVVSTSSGWTPPWARPLVRAADRRRGFRAIHVPGPHTDSGIRPRFRKLTDIRPDLEIVRREDGRADAVLDYVWAIPRGESSFVTVIVPEEFRRASMVAALAAPTELALKMRLLSEPGVVITDVPVARRAT